MREAREINEHLRAVLVLNAADAQGSDNVAAAETLAEAEGLAAGRSVMEQTHET